MGAEAQCRLTFGDRSAEGKALLETNEIIFRGPDLRLKITLKDVLAVDAMGGALHIEFGGGTAIFDLGAKAERWAAAIRNTKGLLDKLGVRPAQRIVVLRVADERFIAQLRERGADVSTRLRKDADIIFMGAERLEDLHRLQKLPDYIKRGGAIWTVTPKGKGGIKDTDVIAAGKAAGLVDTKVAAFSPTHTATKFVIPKALR